MTFTIRTRYVTEDTLDINGNALKKIHNINNRQNKCEVIL